MTIKEEIQNSEKSLEVKQERQSKSKITIVVLENIEMRKIESKENLLKDSLENEELKLESVSLINMFKVSFDNFLNYSTIGGLSELAKRNSLFLRIFWMIFVFGCFSYTLLTVIDKVNEYENYNVVLKKYKYEDIPTRFPSITICNEISFNEKYAFKYLKKMLNFTRTYYDYIYPSSNSNGHLTDFYFVYDAVVDKIPPVNQLKRLIVDSLNQTQLTSLGFNLDSDILISCWSNLYGNCYTFSTNDEVYLTGAQFGLQMEMIVSKCLSFIFYFMFVYFINIKPKRINIIINWLKVLVFD